MIWKEIAFWTLWVVSMVYLIGMLCLLRFWGPK